MEDSIYPVGSIPIDQFEPAEMSTTSTAPGIQPTALDDGSIPIDQFESAEDHYGSLGQQAKTAAEGLAKGLIGNTLTTAIETKALGVDPKDIEARAEENPITSGVAQVAGLGAGLLGTAGLGGALIKGGEAAAALTSAGKAGTAAFEAAPMAARIGSQVVQQATEMAIMAADDELAKKIWYKPEETAEAAISSIGLAAALGGAGGAFVTGAVSPLWKATVGPKVEGFLSSLTGKMGGTAGDAELASAKALFEKAGIDAAQYQGIAAKISGNPTAEQLFSKLSQTDTTKAGRKVQQELKDFTDEVGGKMAETLGVDSKYVSNLESKVDKYTTGNQVAETLHKELDATIKPITDAYDATNNQFKASPISDESKRVISEQISSKGIENGWYKSADDSQRNLMEKVLAKLPEQETAADLKAFITNLRENHPFGSPTYQTARDISNILKNGQELAVMEQIVAKGGSSEVGKAALNSYKELKGEYSKMMDTIDNLNEHLHVGKYFGPNSFLNNLKEMGTANAEGVINRLSGNTKADTLNVLSQFPETFSKIKQYHIDSVLGASKGAEGVDPRKLAKQLDKLSPQVRNLVADMSQQEQIKALAALLAKSDDVTHNFSNTARTIDKITNGQLSPISMIAGALGNTGAAMASHLATIGFKEGKDALSYSMLKFLGSGQPIEPGAFKSMVQMMDATIKGESALNKAVESVFKTGVMAVVRESSDRDISKLDKKVDMFAKDGGKSLTDQIVNSQTGHYLPDHQMALTATTMRAMEYLKSIKPQETKLSPLSQPIPPSKAEVARYNRALEIADNPNIILKRVKDGTIQISDIKDLSTMYPSLYSSMQERLLKQTVGRAVDAEPVPYKTRMGLSLFTATPLDPTMEASSIIAAQPKTPQQAPGMQPQAEPKKNTSKLGKTTASYRTPNQSAEFDRSKRD
jgi:hypothetical protein